MLAFVSNRKTLKKSWRNKGDRDALLLACGVEVVHVPFLVVILDNTNFQQ
jgi:hypothetical protein